VKADVQPSRCAENPLPDLLPGDILLYFTPGSFVDWIIAIKTWSDVAHVEVFEGNGMSSAARAKGVNLYPFRRAGLRYVLRPRAIPDTRTGYKYFQTHEQGRRYNWFGLLGFDWPWNHPLKIGHFDYSRLEDGSRFCSEYAMLRTRASKIRVFDETWPAEKTPPMLFKASLDLRRVWTIEEKFAALD
jgi:hypothetical protein